MVCAFLKIGRKALWERRRNANLAMPRAYRMAGKRNLYRSEEIREWAAWIAGLPVENRTTEVAALQSEAQHGASPIVPLARRSQNARRRADQRSANANQLSLSF